jgi:ubiquinone/menaquinone biosynthesis C-methylase UbiE
MENNVMTDARLFTGWSSVDVTARPKEFIDYLNDVGRIPSVQQLREETYRLLGKITGLGIDVGCGTGEVIQRLAHLGIEGVGLDISKAMVDAARQQFSGHTFVQGSAYELPFPAGHFSWYRSERVVHLLDRPEDALAEAHRVLKEDGLIVILSPDMDSTVFSTSRQYTGLGRAALSAMLELAPPVRGREIPQLMIEAGFKAVEVVPYVLSVDNVRDARRGIIDNVLSAAIKTGALNFEDVHNLHEDMDKLGERGIFSCAVTFSLASGRR